LFAKEFWLPGRESSKTILRRLAKSFQVLPTFSASTASREEDLSAVFDRSTPVSGFSIAMTLAMALDASISRAASNEIFRADPQRTCATHFHEKPLHKHYGVIATNPLKAPHLL
jgi:hypothetical protein